MGENRARTPEALMRSASSAFSGVCSVVKASAVTLRPERSMRPSNAAESPTLAIRSLPRGCSSAVTAVVPENLMLMPGACHRRRLVSRCWLVTASENFSACSTPLSGLGGTLDWVAWVAG